MLASVSGARTMTDIKITNCHVHTFTTAHTPRYFPYKAVVIFRWFPWLIRALRRLSGLLPGYSLYDRLVRLENFHSAGDRRTQAEIFGQLRRQYPAGTRFVVLPMDMAPIEHGPVERDIQDQHAELATLAQDHPDAVIPFATVHPDRPSAFDEFRQLVEDHDFRGLKLYTKLGYKPDHPKLKPVYGYCQDRNLPVMAHCSRGGISHKSWGKPRCDSVTAPLAWEPVLRDFPKLRLCLAHFGGADDWRAYLNDGFDPDDPAERAGNWLSQICRMINDTKYPNLYTDISYTLFRFEEFAPLLRLLLENEKLRNRVLFGSDFYMSRQEHLSERAVSIRLRERIGEDFFRQIAEINPRVYLGETG